MPMRFGAIPIVGEPIALSLQAISRRSGLWAVNFLGPNLMRSLRLPGLNQATRHRFAALTVVLAVLLSTNPVEMVVNGVHDQ